MAIAKLDAVDVLNICDQLRTDDYLDALDRAELARHFGGGALTVECEAAPFVSDNNWLFGHKYLNRAYRQIFSAATSDAGFVEIVVLRSQSAERRRKVERAANECINKVLRMNRRWRHQYAAACGDAVLYGSPYLFRWNKRDWIPAYAGKPLMPRDAPADVNDDKFVRWAFPSELSARSIMEMLKLSERHKEAASTWNTKALRRALRVLDRSLHPNQNDRVLETAFDEDDPEQLEYKMQANALGARTLSASLKVYYFFQKQHDGKVDAYIINRHGEQVLAADGMGRPPMMKINREKGPAGLEMELFYEKERFETVNECLWPLILDTKFGGAQSAHRIQGLGRLNYDMDFMASSLMNSTMHGMAFELQHNFQAQDIGTMKKIDQMVAAGIRPGQVLPPDVNHFEKGAGHRNYGNAFALLHSMDVAQGANASTHALGVQSNRAPRELEVEALERQAHNQQDITARMEDWQDMATPMVQEMVHTLLNRPLAKGDRAWEDRQKLKELLDYKGIFLEELQGDRIEACMRKHLGAGDFQLALSRAEKKIQNLHLFPAASHPMIIREWAAAVDNSSQRAIELVPEEPDPELGQMHQAALEEAQALSTGAPPPVQAWSIPLIHVQSHVKAVSTIVQENQQSGIDMMVANGVAALLEHTMAEANIIGLRGNEDLFKQLSDIIKSLAQAAAQITREPPPTKEEFDMMIKQRSQQLQEEKHVAAVQKNTRAQEHREETDQQKMALALNEAARKERALALEESESVANSLRE